MSENASKKSGLLRNFEISEQRKLAAEKKQANERLGSRIKQAVLATDNISRRLNCGVVALKGATIPGFMEGFIAKVGEERVHRLPANGNIQGSDLGVGHATATLAILRHIGEANQKDSKHLSKGVVIFDETNFGADPGEGTAGVRDRVIGMLRHRSPADPTFLFVGRGEPTDLPTTKGYEHFAGRGEVVNRLGIILALDENNELHTVLPTAYNSRLGSLCPPSVDKLTEPREPFPTGEGTLPGNLL